MARGTTSTGAARREPLLVDLALQGGGAHGAFSWGVIERLNAEWEFLVMLRDEGRRAADVFLAEHGDALGRRSSMDLDILLRQV